MTWRVINDLTSRKTNGPSIKEIKQNGISICNSQELATAFNYHFATVGPKLANEIPLNNNGRTHLHYLNNPLPDITNLELMPTSRSKLSKSKATGLDKISAKLLLICADLIDDSLLLIFNTSIATGIYPEEWKCSKVVPVFKQGDGADLDNYRPISIIPVVAKVFERIIYDQLYACLIANNLLSTHQSGFRSLHSTVTSLLEATDDWAFNIDQGNANAVVFLDLKEAFDTMDHNILISKLSAYGIRGTSIERNQKCFLNGSLSSNRVLSCGIPQGTILGPLLFLLYINDLPNCLMHSQPRMYADDTYLTLAGNSVDSIELNLNEDLASISEWLTANKLTLNKSKTEFMIIGSRQRLKTLPHSPSLKIDGAPISQVPSTKSLGVYIDENLTWNVHIENLSKKIASGIGALKRIRPFVPHKTLLFIYNSLVKPHFDYCNVVWGSCNKTLVNKLKKLQNRAARVLTLLLLTLIPFSSVELEKT